ncbi:MAG: hypothetical protein ACRD50_05200 [Candidatus Acidiferrales bacterium]
MAKPKVHIYSLSRLAFADVTDWQAILKELQEGRKSMYWSYKPLREGALQMATRKNPDTKAIYTAVANLAEQSGGARCRKANLAALEVFEKTFLPRIERVKSNFMVGSEHPVEFGKVQLVGGPHFSVIDAAHRERYIYLHPSKWEHEQVMAFCELLTVVAEEKYQSEARNVWFLDLRNGQDVPWPNSRKLVRRKCERAAELLVAFRAADLAKDES